MREAIFIFSSGVLERHENTLRFTSDKGRRFLPVEATGEIHVFGEVDINVRLLNFLTQHAIPLHIYNYYGYYAGSYMPREQYVSGYVTLQQAAHYMDSSKRMVLARTFIHGALQNMERVLNYYNRRGTDLGEGLAVVNQAIQNVGLPSTVEELMALEGNVRNAYYGLWDSILKGADFRFEGRTRRPPLNRVNSLISFGNSLMYVTCLSEIYRTHLDPRIGFLHSTNHRRYSLNLDVAEVFKPIIVDRVIFTLLNRGVLKATDFQEGSEGVFLKEHARKTFIEAYQARLKDTLQIPRLKRHVSYRRLIRMELYKIEKHLIDDEPYRPYVARW